MIKKIFGSFLINLFAIYTTSYFIKGLVLQSELSSLLIVSAGFTVLHLVLKPLMGIFIKALNFLTLGLAGLVIDSALLYALTLKLPQISVQPWFFPGGEIYSIILPAHSFNTIETTIASALAINFLRTVLMAVFY